MSEEETEGEDFSRRHPIEPILDGSTTTDTNSFGISDAVKLVLAETRNANEDIEVERSAASESGIVRSHHRGWTTHAAGNQNNGAVCFSEQDPRRRSFVTSFPDSSKRGYCNESERRSSEGRIGAVAVPGPGIGPQEPNFVGIPTREEGRATTTVGYSLPAPEHRADGQVVEDIEATVVRREGDQEELPAKGRRYGVVALIFLVFVVGMTTGIMFGFRKIGDGNVSGVATESPQTTETTLVPSIRPTSTPTQTPTASFVGYFINLIHAASPRASFEDPASPQSLALAWLLDDPFTMTASLTDDQVLQRYAIVTFWYSVGGPSPSNATTHGWLQPISECNWTTNDVEILGCDSNQTLTSIVMEHGGFTGSIPAEVGLLGQLEVLDVAQTNLVSTLPSEIGLCSSLKAVGLFTTAMTGTIPTELGQLTLMQYFSVIGDLSGTIPLEISAWSDLRFLWLPNDLEGTLHTGLFSSWTALQMFGVDTNRLSGTIPTEIGLLTALTSFTVNSNLFSGSIPTEVGLWSLQSDVFLFDNSLTGTLPTEIGRWSNVTIFAVSHNMISGTLPSELGEWTALLHFQVLENNIGGPLPSELGQWRHVASIDMGPNPSLSGTIPSEIGLLSLLTFLDFGGMNLNGTIPSEIGQLTLLATLGMGVNNLTGSLPTEVGRLTALERFNAFSNDMDGHLPSEMGQWRHVASIDM